MIGFGLSDAFRVETCVAGDPDHAMISYPNTTPSGSLFETTRRRLPALRTA
jgi:hypothetical protein